MDIAGYLEAIRAVRATGVASEHSYRPALRDLFASIDPDLDVTTKPSEAIFLSGTSGSNAMNFPVYLYGDGDMEGTRENISPKVKRKFSECLGRDVGAKEIFEYVYGVLHSREYRERFGNR